MSDDEVIDVRLFGTFLARAEIGGSVIGVAVMAYVLWSPAIGIQLAMPWLAIALAAIAILFGIADLFILSVAIPRSIRVTGGDATIVYRTRRLSIPIRDLPPPRSVPVFGSAIPLAPSKGGAVFLDAPAAARLRELLSQRASTDDQAPLAS